MQLKLDHLESLEGQRQEFQKQLKDQREREYAQKNEIGLTPG